MSRQRTEGARRALLVDCFGEASAIALVSIAESLDVLAAAARVQSGACVDCGHMWSNHATTHPAGCQATGVPGRQHGTCPCTEPRPSL